MKKITIFIFLFVSVLTNAQKVTVSGKIVDKNQKILTGATVLVKETNQGISSDFDGNFSFKLNKGNLHLESLFHWIQNH
jgi:iron complex outermembrane receptor protein